MSSVVQNAVIQEPAAGALFTLSLPRINTHVPGKGIFRSIMPGVDGAPDYRVYEAVTRIDRGNWADVKAAAEALRDEGQEDWSLPTRAEAALLYAVAKGEHESTWYWTSEPYGSDCAWYQYFGDGNQGWRGQRNNDIRGCAVRREPIQ